MVNNSSFPPLIPNAEDAPKNRLPLLPSLEDIKPHNRRKVLLSRRLLRSRPQDCSWENLNPSICTQSSCSDFMAECRTRYHVNASVTRAHISPICPRELYGQQQLPRTEHHPPPHSQIPVSYTCKMGYPLEGYLGVNIESNNGYNGVSTPPICPTSRRVRKIPPNLNLTPTTLHKDEFQDSPYHFIPVHHNIPDGRNFSPVPCGGAVQKKIRCKCSGSASRDENRSDQERPRTDTKNLAPIHGLSPCNLRRSFIPKIRNGEGRGIERMDPNSFSSHHSAFIPCPQPALCRR